MNIFTRTRLLLHLRHWKKTCTRRNTHYRYTVPDNPKFMGPRDAAQLIPDGAVLATSGLAGNQRTTIMWWAMRELFEETRHPANLTLICTGGHGGRGKIPGTLEELAVDGLITRFFTGHTETFKGMLRMADAGALEFQVIPQGTFARLLTAHTRGEDSLTTATGIGTFIDPECGRGTPLAGASTQYVERVPDGLRFTCPKITVAVWNAPAADRKGNIYARGAAMIGEGPEISRIARRNGGKVIVNVGKIVPEGYGPILIPAEEVDAIVYYPDTEQTLTVPHRRAWKFLTTESNLSIEEGAARAAYINELLGITPMRAPSDMALARLAARLFARHAFFGMSVDIGVGLPEQVAHTLARHQITPQLVMMNESGVFGGQATPGIFFGAAVNPTEIVSSPEAFRRIYERLDAVILGVLEADSAGNVNVSKRGEGAINYVGPGGFIDLTTCAKLVVFCGSWMAKGEVTVDRGLVHLSKRGVPKFIEQVSEVTFNGREALKRGQRVYYVTHIGAFELTPEGMCLRYLMPGINLEQDVLEFAPMRILIPEGGPEIVPREWVTGENYTLSLEGQSETGQRQESAA